MKEKRFILLVIVLFAILALRPILITLGSRAVVLDLLTIGLFLFCIDLVSDSRRHIVFASILLGLGMSARFLAEVNWFESLQMAFFAIYDGMAILFIAFTCIPIIGYVLRGTRVTQDRIAAAIFVYLLLGLLWSSCYQLSYTLDPSAFDFTNSAAALSVVERNSSDFLYFSFVTLTTLGYGDVAPMTPPVRYLAALEAIIGQLYIAVLIACLVGTYIAQKDLRDG